MEKEEKVNGASSTGAYAELRRLLIGPERDQISALEQRLNQFNLRPEDVGEVLPVAVRLRASRNNALANSLAPVMEEAIRISIRRNPKILSDALFPIIGAAVRKAVAAALQAMMQTLNQAVEQSLSWRSMQWRLEAARTGRSFAEIVLVRSLLYKVEQVFLIHKRTGLLLQQRASESAVVRDPTLVSGMLTAIQDFVRDSFGPQADQELETMRVGDLDVWIQHSPHGILAAVIRGTPPATLQNVFAAALEEISRLHGKELEHFDGDTSPFRPCQEQLKLCMLGQGSGKTARYTALWWAAPVVLLLLLGLGIYFTRGNPAWDGYLRQLQAQPGIAITSVQKHDGKYAISGLRDPLAIDPALLLKDNGVDPATVEFHWEPYYSLHPAFEATRTFRAEKAWIEDELVTFEQNVYQLDAAGAARMAALARHGRSLLDAATELGRPASIELTGHADRVGTAAENEILARRRAEEVRDRLLAAGIRSDRITTRTPGPADPTNLRGVSFRIESAGPK